MKSLTVVIELPDAHSRVTAQLLGMRVVLLDGMGLKSEATDDHKLLADQKDVPLK